MNRPELYQRSMDVLVEAYFNDTLIHHTCYACAVGNLVAAANNVEIKGATSSTAHWVDKGVVYDSHPSVMDDGVPMNLRWWNNALLNEGLPDFNGYGTGYSVRELREIEYAFEHREEYHKDWDMFNSLMRVVDALDEIHEVEDPLVTNSSKQRFKDEQRKLVPQNH